MLSWVDDFESEIVVGQTMKGEDQFFCYGTCGFEIIFALSEVIKVEYDCCSVAPHVCDLIF